MRNLVCFIIVMGLLAACSGDRAREAYSNFTHSVKSQFYRYNYKSNLETYRPASWRPDDTEKRYVARQPDRRENWKNYKVGGPYFVLGQWYYPEEDANYTETGMASWYGAEFHNKLTANGEIFDKNIITAAHRTLPMPSMVRVTNLENGRSILVRVNDRGPFAKDRVIDLSERAARELGFREKGTAKVKVELDRQATEDLFYDPWDADEVAKPQLVRAMHATSPERTTIAQREVNFYREHFVQAGAYSTWDNASSAATGLKKIAPTHIQEGDYRGGIVYRVKLGPFQDVEEAGKVLDQVAMMGFSDAIVLGE